MKRIIIFLLIVFSTIIFLDHSKAYPWSNDTTHMQLTRGAVDFLRSRQLIRDCDETDTIQNHLANGSRDEDSPFTMAWFHFYPAIDASQATATCSSVECKRGHWCRKCTAPGQPK